MPCGEIINYGHGTGCIFSVCILITTDPNACTQSTQKYSLFIVETLLHFVLVRNVELPSHGDRQCRAHSCSRDHPALGGLCPMGAILLLPAIMEIPAVLWYRTEADAGGSGCSLWQSLDLLWKKSLHPKELEDGVCYFRAAQGEALQSSTLPFCHLHS